MLSTLFYLEASAHGSMVWPPTWFYPNAVKDDVLAPFNQCGGMSSCDWFTNYTFVKKRTMAADSPMRTYAVSDPDYGAWTGDYDGFFSNMGSNPWAYPGSAKINSPCGTYGGNPDGCDGVSGAGKDCNGGGVTNGPDAREAYGKKAGFMGSDFDDVDLAIDPATTLTTVVEAGGTLDAHFVIQANHGGGYAYRLCKVPEDGDMTKLTEKCFQANTLKYASDYSWVQYGSDKKNSMPFKAMRSTNGTYPAGSTWTRNPIAPCADDAGGFVTEAGNNCAEADGATQFEPVIPGIQGFGLYVQGGMLNDLDTNSFAFTIGDSLQIPANMEPGKYVLSWRWDCEQTPQIWATCSNLEITAPSKPAQPRKRKHTPSGLPINHHRKKPNMAFE